MVSSRSSHDEYDRDIASLLTDFLRGILSLESLRVLFDVSYQLLWDIGRSGAAYIMAPHYECDIIALTAEGYYHNRDDDSDREMKL